MPLHDCAVRRGEDALAVPPEVSPLLDDFARNPQPSRPFAYAGRCSLWKEGSKLFCCCRRVLLSQYRVLFFRPLNSGMEFTETEEFVYSPFGIAPMDSEGIEMRRKYCPHYFLDKGIYHFGQVFWCN